MQRIIILYIILSNRLHETLFDSGRIDDAIRASKDETYRNQLIQELLSDDEY